MGARQRTGLFAILGAACLLPGSVRADPPAAAPVALEPPGGRFLPYAPLTLEDLWAKRMRFTRGEPMISVGIMEHQRSVSLRADGPTRVMFDEASLPKTSFAPPDTRFTFKVLSARPAELRWWVIVGHRGYADAEAAAKMEAEWTEAGHPARTFEVGTIVALRGNVLDTRERRVGIGGFPTRAKAEALAAELFRTKQLRTTLHEELLEPPRGLIGVYDERERLLHKAESWVYFGTVQGGQVEVLDVEHGRGYASHGHEHRRFWGHIYVVLDRAGKLTVMNSVGAEKLLGGLVPAEIFATAPLEALKAQAVTARGEIFSKLGHRHFGEPYHLCSEQHCQVYAGAAIERRETNEAVARTRGLLAFRPRDGQGAPLVLVDSVYSSTCGGYSEANEVVWDDVASPSLRARIDGMASDPALARFSKGLGDEAALRAWLLDYPPTECARSSFVRADKYRWKKTLSAAKLDDLVKGHGIGKLVDVEILGRGDSGRIRGVRLVGSSGSAEVLRELPVRRLFGNLNSGMFVMDKQRDAKGALRSITFVGGGWGHGVGMCQMGAIGRAERKQSFEQILSHYYDGAVVERIY